jgi:hypothetical protein
MMRGIFLAILAVAITAGGAMAAEPGGPALRLVVEGDAGPVFIPSRDACDGADVPDAPLRAFRDAAGGIVAFGMHDVNRALRGPSLDRLKLDCRIVLASAHDPDPAAYDDHNWITATWTNDGRVVDALVHHEYHADEHPGRCAFKDYMSCWYNAIVAYRSHDGGRSFTKNPAGAVVAAAPFKQDVGQGRHRGFFNPSNIVADGAFFYFMAATTGWTGQSAGVCLFRTGDPADSTSWRAFDGTSFSRRFADPYAPQGPAHSSGTPCQPIAPFPTPVGAIVRHRPSGNWLAIFQAKRDGATFAVSGFYYATSRDLLHWSTPRLLVMGDTLYDDPCSSGGQLINYPSLLDPATASRNFTDVGASASLFYATLAVDGCKVTSRRDLVKRQVRIEAAAGEQQ